VKGARTAELLAPVSGRPDRVRRQVAAYATVAAYAALLAMLVWSRLSNLSQGLWHDEIFTVEHFVRGGPSAIFGDYLPNDHMLFSLLAWLAQLVSPTEVVLRLPSVVPFIAGALIATVWLDRRIGRATAIVYFGLVTASPLLLDLSWQARGYGLAFLAMSVLLVAADESARDGARWKLVAFSGAGVVGTLTLPIFGAVFAATALALAIVVRGVMPFLVASAVAIAAWYAPVASDLVASSGQEFGSRLAWHGLVTGPFEYLLVPGLVGGSVVGTTGFVAAVCLAGICTASPLLRDRTRALLLLAGPTATFLIVWATRLYVAPRFLSFLLVPVFVVLATGGIVCRSPPSPSLWSVRSAASSGGTRGSNPASRAKLTAKSLRSSARRRRGTHRSPPTWHTQRTSSSTSGGPSSD
jgi:hypothetical protein